MVVVYVICWGGVVLSMFTFAMQIKDEIFPTDAYKIK